MSLGSSLFNARKRSALSQEAVAEKLGVSRQTISKWETDETLPDIYQSKKLAAVYHLSLDELVDFDMEAKELEQIVRNTGEETQKKVDWNKLWAEKYPILAAYKQEVKTAQYEKCLKELMERLKDDYGYSELDSFLVLKDILAGLWNEKQTP